MDAAIVLDNEAAVKVVGSDLLVLLSRGEDPNSHAGLEVKCFGVEPEGLEMLRGEGAEEAAHELQIRVQPLAGDQIFEELERCLAVLQRALRLDGGQPAQDLRQDELLAGTDHSARPR